jgi:asparagine synthase (glutamine-hydrolysing)
MKNMARKLGQLSRASLQKRAYWLSNQMFDILVERRSMVAQSHAVPSNRRRHVALSWRLNDAFYALVKEKIERGGAQFGLELRAPMHRRKYVEWAFGTPERMRQRGDVSKYVHLQALAGLLPPAVVCRNIKADFSFMFRHQMDRMKQQFVETIPREQGDWVTADGMARLYQAYSKRSLVGYPMWTLWSVFSCCCFLCEVRQEVRQFEF